MKHIFLEVQERIKQTIPEVKWTDQDLGQLEFYTERPAVLFPCVLIDFDDISYSDMGMHAQLCNCNLKLRIGFNVVQHSNNVTPNNQREKALEIFDVLAKIHNKLHGWSGSNFGELTRIRMVAEPREDSLRVYIIHFSVSYEEYKEKKPTQKISRPKPVLTEGSVFGDEFDKTFS